MDIEKLIEQYMQAADKWEKRHPVTDTFDLRVQDALRDASTALSTLQAENEKLRETVDKYATAARVIALHLKPFCDESLPYDEMIADATRKSSDELEQKGKYYEQMVDALAATESAELEQVKRENSHLKERLYGMEKD